MTTPFAHDDNALTDAHDLGQFARDENHGHSFAGELLNHRVNLRFGADIDASGGLVENKHLGIDLQPARKEELLLVAAGKPAGANPKGSRAQTKRLRLSPGTLINVT